MTHEMTREPTVPQVGRLQPGPRDCVTDVPGVTVGHATLDEGDVHTGVTVIRPHGGDAFLQRVPAGIAVFNGFGKSAGLLQVEELGVLETPIALTNTFSVPAVAAAQIRQCVGMNSECGRSLPTVNPLVFECNDGYLNDIQRMAVTEADYLRAHDSAAADLAQGSIGAGRGMSSFGLKGGIGSASRRASVGAFGSLGTFTLGALVLANFGVLADLMIVGQSVGRMLSAQSASSSNSASTPTSPSASMSATSASAALPASDAIEPEKGSIIIILATDAPLDARQLRRLARRAGAGLARTGSSYGHGSGDIALAFSTAYTVPQHTGAAMPTLCLLHDALLDGLFHAAADATEQAILHALWRATSFEGRSGHVRQTLLDALRNLPANG